MKENNEFNEPCGICRPLKLKCKGHGKTGGGGSSGGGGGKSDDMTYKSHQTASSTSGQVPTAAIPELEKAKAVWMQSELFNYGKINFEAELIAIEYNKAQGNIIFQVKPGLSKNDIELVHDFLKTINNEFNEFKNHLTELGVATHSFTAELKENELNININHPKYYDAFLISLDNKNLLPTPNLELGDKEEMVNKLKQQDKKRFSPFGDIKQGPKPKGLQ